MRLRVQTSQGDTVCQLHVVKPKQHQMDSIIVINSCGLRDLRVIYKLNKDMIPQIYYEIRILTKFSANTEPD